MELCGIGIRICGYCNRFIEFSGTSFAIINNFNFITLTGFNYVFWVVKDSDCALLLRFSLSRNRQRKNIERIKCYTDVSANTTLDFRFKLAVKQINKY